MQQLFDSRRFLITILWSFVKKARKQNTCFVYIVVKLQNSVVTS